MCLLVRLVPSFRFSPDRLHMSLVSWDQQLPSRCSHGDSRRVREVSRNTRCFARQLLELLTQILCQPSIDDVTSSKRNRKVDAMAKSQDCGKREVFETIRPSTIGGIQALLAANDYTTQ